MHMEVLSRDLYSTFSYFVPGPQSQYLRNFCLEIFNRYEGPSLCDDRHIYEGVRNMTAWRSRDRHPLWYVTVSQRGRRQLTIDFICGPLEELFVNHARIVNGYLRYCTLG